MRRVLLLIYMMAGAALAHPTHHDRVEPSSPQISGLRATASPAANAPPSPKRVDNRHASDDNRFCVTTPKGKVNCVLLPTSGH